MKFKAYAKINLSLDIINRRDDGYHNINSVMLPIDMYDEIDIEIAKKMSYSSNTFWLKFDEKNTIVKAVNYMKNNYQINDNFKIYLKKYIPSQAGLGGGSADASCVLKAISKMYKINMSKKEIERACKAIGADVLFTYYNKPAQISGIGERFKKIEVKNDYYALLIKPNKGVSTKAAYESLNIDVCDHPDIDKLITNLKYGRSIDGLLKNSLEEPAFKLCPDIKKIKDYLINKGLKNVLMSGSGSTVFAISEDFEELKKIKSKIFHYGWFIKIVKITK